MGGEITEAWRALLDDLVRRGPPEFLILDGAPGLEAAIALVWDGVPVKRCTVHKHRNLLAHAPERLHEEITADYNDMIYAAAHEQGLLQADIAGKQTTSGNLTGLISNWPAGGNKTANAHVIEITL